MWYVNISIYIHTMYIRMMYIYICIYYILILYRVYILNIDKNTKLCHIVWYTHVTDLMISSHYDVMWTLFRRMFVCFVVSVCWSSDRWNLVIVRFDQIYLFANQKGVSFNTSKAAMLTRPLQGFVSLSHMEIFRVETVPELRTQGLEPLCHVHSFHNPDVFFFF